MEPWLVVVLVGGVGLGLFIGLNEYQKRKKLKEGGFTSKRSGAYWSQVQVYTTKAAFDDLFESVKRFFPPVIEGRRSAEGDYMMFKGSDWAAQMERTGEEAGRAVYEFQFVEFSRTNGSVSHTQEMDAALTAVERSLLVEDPFTRVVSKPNTGLRSRPSLF